MSQTKLNPEGKELLKRLIDTDISQKQLAKHLDITPQAVNNRIKRGSVDVLHEAIEEIKNN